MSSTSSENSSPYTPNVIFDAYLESDDDVFFDCRSHTPSPIISNPCDPSEVNSLHVPTTPRRRCFNLHDLDGPLLNPHKLAKIFDNPPASTCKNESQDSLALVNESTDANESKVQIGGNIRRSKLPRPLRSLPAKSATKISGRPEQGGNAITSKLPQQPVVQKNESSSVGRCSGVHQSKYWILKNPKQTGKPLPPRRPLQPIDANNCKRPAQHPVIRKSKQSLAGISSSVSSFSVSHGSSCRVEMACTIQSQESSKVAVKMPVSHRPMPQRSKSVVGLSVTGMHYVAKKKKYRVSEPKVSSDNLQVSRSKSSIMNRKSLKGYAGTPIKPVSELCRIFSPHRQAVKYRA